MRSRSIVVAAAAALLLGTIASAASARAYRTASAQFGTISNFDVFNDTGQETNGFEIELDGVSSTDITYTFGAPYERYGNPTITPFAGGVYVIYASPWDAAAHRFTQSTPLAPTPIQPTAGHQCWTGGSPTYPTAGCEHFGLGLAVNPTNVVYHWLVADPVHQGQLVQFGGNVPVPAPQWSTSPPLHPAVNPKPVVNAVAAAPEPDAGQQLGEAVWVKVYMNESTAPSDLNHLVSGDIHVPDAAAEVETDWLLIQAGGNSLQSELANSDQIGAKSQSVVRKYQFFKYTGPYDVESHEATPVNDSQPSAGELGDLIGNQMAGLNLAVAGKVPGDRVRPKAFFVSKPAPTTTSRNATFKVRATDNVLGTKFTYFCSLDKKIPSRCKNPVTFSALKKGAHSLSVYAIDKAGNPSKALTYRWSIK